MTSFDILKIVVACIGFGAAGELIRRYQKFKARRRAIPPEVRNAGFWTDSRLGHAELIFCCMFMAIPFTAIVSAVSYNRPIWVYPALLVYASCVYLWMVALNRRTPQ